MVDVYLFESQSLHILHKYIIIGIPTHFSCVDTAVVNGMKCSGYLQQYLWLPVLVVELTRLFSTRLHYDIHWPYYAPIHIEPINIHIHRHRTPFTAVFFRPVTGRFPFPVGVCISVVYNFHIVVLPWGSEGCCRRGW